MRASTFLVVLGSASLGLAQPPLPQPIDDSADPAKKPLYDCLSSEATISRSQPTQPPALSSWSWELTLTGRRTQTLETPLNSAGGPELYCTSVWLPLQQATPPASLLAEDAEWKSSWGSWRESVSPVVHSMASHCKTIGAETIAGLALFEIATDVQECATAMSVVFGGAAAQATGVSNGGAGSGGAATSTTSSAAGARETAGVVVGAMALVGLLGGVAAL
ncbi:hypothetical protein QBC38DRAFT_490972 [Podospora fimiseda]|uniref:Uncharacterized protein n=1 Tax=Podospora fimiseda TaxID=252190 RepID=A0AAN6YMG9_9PEZI|nr:hypothetical protein QBC38DRAFT_490972 [Podospora fimiseda]